MQISLPRGWPMTFYPLLTFVYNMQITTGFKNTVESVKTPLD